MTLLITVFAAIITTIVWYKKASTDDMGLGRLALMYWGASLMWMVDSLMEYIEDSEGFFNPEPMDMLNDAFLGFSVVALGLIIWIGMLIIKDPKGIVKAALIKK